MSKSAKYYYDAEAIKIDAAMDSGFVKQRLNGTPQPQKTSGFIKEAQNGNGLTKFIDAGQANKRSVWTVTTRPYSEAHFATFPERLITDCIKAGCPENGIILDPFIGAGTTGLVAKKLNRNYVGIELNQEYINIAEKRIYHQIGIFQ